MIISALLATVFIITNDDLNAVACKTNSVVVRGYTIGEYAEMLKQAEEKIANYEKKIANYEEKFALYQGWLSDYRRQVKRYKEEVAKLDDLRAKLNSAEESSSYWCGKYNDAENRLAEAQTPVINLQLSEAQDTVEYQEPDVYVNYYENNDPPPLPSRTEVRRFIRDVNREIRREERREERRRNRR